MKREASADRILLTGVLILVLIGIIMVFDSSFYYALQRFGDQYHFLRKEVLWAGIGLAGMLAMSWFPYRWLRNWAVPVLFATLVLLALVFTPAGVELNGARRWINLKFTTFMPGEFAKFSVALFMAAQLSRENSGLRRPKDLLPYVLVVGLIFALIMKQPNMSTAITVVGVAFAQLFIAGLPYLYVVLGAGMGAMGALILVLTSDYRMKRLTTFLDPFKDSSDTGWQVTHSLLALGSGGFFGVGLGESIQNKLYIPEPQNDFIFATIGEEFGFIGSAVVILLFVVVIWRGVKIAMNARDRFGFFLASGIVATIGVQTVLNIAVATASMPATGIALPFISYGGNSLTLLMAEVGILLNISRSSLNLEED